MTQTPPKGSKVTKIFLIIGAIVLFLMLGCCGIFTMCTYWVGKASNTAVEMGHERMKAEMAAKGVSMSGVTEGPNEVKLPDNFPKDVPIFPGLKATFTIGDTATGAGSAAFTMKGNKSADVVTFFRDQMKTNGWTQDTTMAVDKATVMVFSKEARTVSMTVTGGDDDTVVQIGYGKK